MGFDPEEFLDEIRNLIYDDPITVLFFMLFLVLGKNMLMIFAGWEGVGIASYLLIGF